MTTDQLTYDVSVKYADFVEYTMELIVENSLNREYTTDEFGEALIELRGLMDAHIECCREMKEGV